ncbi:ribokinase [Leifsonia sp. C5G2]|uniref:ribokinase n=1 Tax=Leifsonia sp. C5G2 TaxID=2735269 RepID=UPI0015848F5D|nr:ribokinase [Leifsonia sp. C5G2]NUU07745.1 ribokinase [Leifsonia sp. C5G2]
MTTAVVGSANLDLVYRVERIPSPGETVLAVSSDAVPGGKGNNQAVAAARAGAEVTFVVALGRDAAGDRLAAEARVAGVRVLDRRVDAPTGTALITVDAAGENSIVVDSGANARLSGLTAGERDAVTAADVLLLQLETPLETVAEAAALARAAGTLVVLNAAPVRQLPDELLDSVDLLVVNEHEAGLLAPAAASPQEAAQALAGARRAVVLTLGGDGSLVVVPGAEPAAVPAHRVEVVDTTGAGDTFCGALAAELDRSGFVAGRAKGTATRDLRGATALGALVSAARFASAAGALSVQRAGAVPSIPTLEEIRALIADR